VLEENNKLEVGRIYETYLRGEKIGIYLFLGKRRRFNTKGVEHPKPVYVIAGISIRKEANRPDCLKFNEEDYSLSENRLELTSAEPNHAPPNQWIYLEDRLQKAGLL